MSSVSRVYGPRLFYVKQGNEHLGELDLTSEKKLSLHTIAKDVGFRNGFDECRFESRIRRRGKATYILLTNSNCVEVRRADYCEKDTTHDIILTYKLCDQLSCKNFELCCNRYGQRASAGRRSEMRY